MRRLTVMTATCVGLMLVAAGCNHDGRYLRPATPDQNVTISTTVLATTEPTGDVFEPATIDLTGAVDTAGPTTLAPTTAEPTTTLAAVVSTSTVADSTTTTPTTNATATNPTTTAGGIAPATDPATTTIKTVDLGGTPATLPGSSSVPSGPGPNAQAAGTDVDDQGSPVAVLLSAVAPWRQGAPIDNRFTCLGADVSPPLSWSAAPAGTVEIAITMSDVQAPAFVHWAIAGIDPTATSIVEGADVAGVVRGVNGDGKLGYSGPCPPAGQTHTYLLSVHFLGSQIELGDGAAGSDMVVAIDAASIGKAVVIGTAGRN